MDRCPSPCIRRVAVTQVTDPAMAFVGSGPEAGEGGALGIVLPPEPTLDRFHRYTCKLAAFDIADGEVVRVLSMRHLLTIGVEIAREEEPAYVYELQVTDPTWCFPDGNVGFYLTRCPHTWPEQSLFDDTAFGPPFSSQLQGTAPSILARYLPPSYGGPGYVPLQRGAIPGTRVNGVGSIHGMRWPLGGCHKDDVDLLVEGPCLLAMWASIHQTNPLTRPDPPPLAELDWLRREDLFVRRNSNARYWRVGGELTIEICDALTDKERARCEPPPPPEVKVCP